MEELKLPYNFSEVDVGKKDSEGRVALHYAASNSDVDIIEKIFLKDKTLINAMDNNGQSPITMAVINGNLMAVEFFYNHGVSVDQYDNERHSIVHWAVVCGQLEVLQLLLKAGASINVPDLYGAYPLHYATVIEDISEEKNIAILHLLIRTGNEVDLYDIDKRTPAAWATSQGNLEALKLLISSGADKHHIDKDKLNLLHCAASHGHEHVLEYLLKIVDRKLVKGRDRNGDTPLYYSSAFGHIECTRLLLKYKADPNVQDYRLRTPSHCAAIKGNLQILKLLRQYGASFSMVNYNGDLPFHEAVQCGSKDVVEYLYTENVECISAVNNQGISALHIAAATGNMEIVVFLASKGADYNGIMMRGDKLMTPLDIAESRNHEDVANFLRTVHRARRASDMPEKIRRSSQATIERQNSKVKELLAECDGIDSVDEKSIDGDNDSGSDIDNDCEENKKTKEDEENEELRSLISNSNILNKKNSNTSSLNSYNSEIAEFLTKKLVDDSIKHAKHIADISEDENECIKKAEEGISDESPEMIEKISKGCQTFNSPKNRVSLTKKERDEKLNKKTDEDDRKSDYDLLVDYENKTGNKRLPKYEKEAKILHEKAIFDELTHLKKTQLQYGKVQEKTLVKTLIENFCKMHKLPVEQFKFTTFYSWEKFLYESLTDQLKVLYLEERERIQNVVRNNAGNKAAGITFESKIRNATPLNDKIRELGRIYSTASLSSIGNAYLPHNRLPLSKNNKKTKKSCVCNKEKKIKENL
ncbi:Ankyrin repeat and Ankyrin repeat-containing domain-containing protein [Strongyloides ratti]|uniref:Ankyrin repeat and Ankyrin repeat-containing domain-containing protein n=1 Tax=Strongyloides ratti TaxID=34506 RepID=A0A090KV09_STRRB|nr:Ankyrin repeat and Ankyrin repeat-containing domain-containing protein [Strongyloides ratti]CEF61226.1 Ankyrin repeat and Ankyrin repeat-containing domain-containing protein [Strongyloides ratti]